MILPPGELLCRVKLLRQHFLPLSLVGLDLLLPICRKLGYSLPPELQRCIVKLIVDVPKFVRGG